MSITDDIMHSLKDGPIGAGLLFRQVRDMRRGHLTHQYFDLALTKLTAEGRIKGVIMNNDPDVIPEMGSPEDTAPAQVTLFDTKCIALDHAIHAVGARNIDSSATHLNNIVDAAQRFENYLLGIVENREKKKAKQSSGGMVKYPDEISVKVAAAELNDLETKQYPTAAELVDGPGYPAEAGMDAMAPLPGEPDDGPVSGYERMCAEFQAGDQDGPEDDS